MASGRGVSMRSPGGGPNLRGVGGVVEKGNMVHVHALRVLIMLRPVDSFLFSPLVIVSGWRENR